MTLIPSYPNSRMHQAYVSFFVLFLGALFSSEFLSNTIKPISSKLHIQQ